jgi:hypothetical protein
MLQARARVEGNWRRWALTWQSDKYASGNSPDQRLRQYLDDRRVVSLETLIAGVGMDRTLVEERLHRMIMRGEVEVIEVHWCPRTSDGGDNRRITDYYRIHREVDLHQLLKRRWPGPMAPAVQAAGAA